MDPFAPLALVEQHDFYALFRRGDVLGVRIEGELTDARNPVWRATVDAHVLAAGWPRFMALDVRKAIPMASLPRRVQTALWGRRALEHLEWGLLGVGQDARVGITVKAILRVAGMDNVSITLHDDALVAGVLSMCAGRRPGAA